MNVYDFDGTIYPGDSTVDLVKFTLKKYPKLIYRIFPIGLGLLKMGLHIVPKEKAKEPIYRLFAAVDNPKELIKEFWDANQHKIYPWYLAQQKEDDVISSASPLFSIGEICSRLNIKYVMASPVDLETGKSIGINNDGANKVKSFNQMFPDGKIDKFYSDSRHDQYLASLAKEAYLVLKDGKVVPW